MYGGSTGIRNTKDMAQWLQALGAWAEEGLMVHNHSSIWVV